MQLAEDVYIFDLLCTVYFIYCKLCYLKLVSSNWLSSGKPWGYVQGNAGNSFPIHHACGTAFYLIHIIPHRVHAGAIELLFALYFNLFFFALIFFLKEFSMQRYSQASPSWIYTGFCSLCFCFSDQWLQSQMKVHLCDIYHSNQESHAFPDIEFQSTKPPAAKETLKPWNKNQEVKLIRYTHSSVGWNHTHVRAHTHTHVDGNNKIMNVNSKYCVVWSHWTSDRSDKNEL